MMSVINTFKDKSGKQIKTIGTASRKIKKITFTVLSVAILLGNGLSVSADAREERLEAQRNMPVASNEVENWPAGPVVSAESAILMEAETGAVLYAKNIHQKEYPASTTKLMTCLLATENCSMDEVVTMSHTAIYDTPYDSSHIAMDVGESITMEQALNAILIRSANEVSFAVAEHISGTWQDFAQLMNQRAAELGCEDTHFVNPNGLPDENHYTSAFDLATIGRAFFANELLCKISSTALLHIPPSPTQPDDILESSSNQLLPGKKYAYEYLVGSKTGYTNVARNCLVSCAEKDGLKLICVVMRDESPLQFADTVSLFDYGFGNFDMINVSQNETKYKIDDMGFFYSDTNIFGNSKSILSLNQDDRIVMPKTIRFEDIESSLSYDTPDQNQVALITYTYKGVYLGEASVDLAESADSYQFEAAPNPAETGEAVENIASEDNDGTKTETAGTQGKEPAVIFINFMKIFIVLAVLAALVFVFVIIRIIAKNYVISPRHARRRYHAPSRHRRKNGGPNYDDLRTRHKMQIKAAKQKYKKSRRRR
jgi:D-alanyl-D-alanine carboxypeptidase